MKKTHIALLVLMAASIAIIVSMFGAYSTYETFGTASKSPGKEFRVVGVLHGNKKVNYDPQLDPNHCNFLVKDKSGDIKKVIFNGEKPRDIEKSEQIVMVGRMEGNEFRCTQIQMKCPSKYKNDQIVVGNAS